jgi:hypothetical protein
MNKFLLLALFLAPAAFAQTPGPVDGEWKGRSDGGSCNAPLDFALSIEEGLVDGTAFDTTAKGPVPNLKRTAAPAPGPGLWQLHGVARGGSFSLLAVASTKGEEQRKGRISVTVQGAALVVTESGGCGRTARLARN